MTSAFQFPEHLRNHWLGRSVPIALIVSRFHAEVTKSLAVGAIQALRNAGFGEEHIEIIYVPGAFEIPQALAHLSAQPHFVAFVALGCIIQGETSHHQHLAAAVHAELLNLASHRNLPIGTGILTTSTLEQALERCGGKWGNKGEEAACAALELLDLWQVGANRNKENRT